MCKANQMTSNCTSQNFHNSLTSRVQGSIHNVGQPTCPAVQHLHVHNTLCHAIPFIYLAAAALPLIIESTYPLQNDSSISHQTRHIKGVGVPPKPLDPKKNLSSW